MTSYHISLYGFLKYETKSKGIDFINIKNILPLDNFVFKKFDTFEVFNNNQFNFYNISIKGLKEPEIMFLNDKIINEIYRIKKEQLSESEYCVFRMLIETSDEKAGE